MAACLLVSCVLIVNSIVRCKLPDQNSCHIISFEKNDQVTDLIVRDETALRLKINITDAKVQNVNVLNVNEAALGTDPCDYIVHRQTVQVNGKECKPRESTTSTATKTPRVGQSSSTERLSSTEGLSSTKGLSSTEGLTSDSEKPRESTTSTATKTPRVGYSSSIEGLSSTEGLTSDSEMQSVTRNNPIMTGGVTIFRTSVVNITMNVYIGLIVTLILVFVRRSRNEAVLHTEPTDDIPMVVITPQPESSISNDTPETLTPVVPPQSSPQSPSTHSPLTSSPQSSADGTEPPTLSPVSISPSSPAILDLSSSTSPGESSRTELITPESDQRSGVYRHTRSHTKPHALKKLF